METPPAGRCSVTASLYAEPHPPRVNYPGRSGAGPGGEPGAELGDVAGAEPEAGEGRVVHPVKTPACVGEIPVLQARIEPAGEADHLVDDVVRSVLNHVAEHDPRSMPATRGEAVLYERANVNLRADKE